MILPILAYGHPVLKQKAVDIHPDENGIEELIANMWETMYHASGVGLAAPQVGKSLRIFIIDTLQMYEGEEKSKGVKQVFINPEIVQYEGEDQGYEEGCLSIPKIRGEVTRKEGVRLRYLDEAYNRQEKEFNDLNARVILHEYDHLEGILFTELLKPVKKRMIQRKLDAIRKGKVETDYEMIFYK